MNSTDVILSLRKKCFSTHQKNLTNHGMCRRVFDGFLCWPPTNAGELAVQNCSWDILESTEQGLATRQCLKNGTWFVPPGHRFPFSNISQCGMFFITTNKTTLSPPISDLDIFYSEWIPRIKGISYCGYTLSIISLILSICIFISIKRLRCSRNTLHINLFISFILRSLMSILKDAILVRGTALSADVQYDSEGLPVFSASHSYSWTCKALNGIRYYFIISNFMFMLMEGLYLHNLMFLKLFSDHHSVGIYCVLGWGLPLAFVIPWITLRVLYEDLMCWTTKDNIYISLFIDLPIYSTVVINFILFLLIVRVLTAKLNNICLEQRKFKYRKLLKATMILIPLFGVPYVFSALMSLFIVNNPALDIVYLFFDQSFAAFQGLFAALVYCVLNSEVQIEIKRKYSLIKDKNDKEFRRSRTISNTQQVSLNVLDDSPEDENGVLCNDKEIKQITSVQADQQCYF
ncbi:parathyroid hormone/parathyroid hormone-related peptide receptor-like isoform X1 [Diabrotica undecimpunctata]|uniref:parathyroid hormone/parathyroid hormone-related peptide receptor-like isoform X1 n=2 Tax=Diabrotica undecimpunctata TaxID=50387 RepID=UPI003B64168F